MHRKYIFLLSSLITILILAGFMFISKETGMSSKADLDNIQDNSVVSIESRVIEAHPYQGYVKIGLENSLELICKGCNTDIIGKKLLVKAIVDEYNGRKSLVLINYKIKDD